MTIKADELAIRMEIADALRDAKRTRIGTREGSGIVIRIQTLGLNRPMRAALLNRIADEIAEKPSERTP